MIDRKWVLISLSLLCLASQAGASSKGENEPEKENGGQGGNFRSRMRGIMRRGGSMVKHAVQHRQGLLENYLTGRIFTILDHSCKANESGINTILECYTSNEQFMQILQGDMGRKCSKELAEYYGKPENAIRVDDPKRMKEFICNNWKVFDDLSACTYSKMVHVSNWKHIKVLVETKVEVSKCFLDRLFNTDQVNGEEMRLQKMFMRKLEAVCKKPGEEFVEMTACMENNENLQKALKSGSGATCYAKLIDQSKGANAADKLKDQICNNMDKFLQMLLECFSAGAGEVFSPEEMEGVSQTFPELGLCMTGVVSRIKE